MIKKYFISSCLSGAVFCLIAYVYFSGKLSHQRLMIADLERDIEDKVSEINELKETVAYLKEKQKNTQSKNRFRSRNPVGANSSKKEMPQEIQKEKRVSKETKKTKKTTKKPTKDKFAEKVLQNYVKDQYQELYQELGLSEEEEKKLTSVLATTYELQQSLTFKLLDSSVSNEDILKEQETYYKQQKEATDSILSADQSERLKLYNDSLPEKTSRKVIKSSLQGIEFSDNEMREQVLDVIQNTYKDYQSKFTLNNLQGSPLEVFTEENIGESRESIRQMQTNPNVIKEIVKEEKNKIKKASEQLSSLNLSKEKIQKIKTALESRTKLMEAMIPQDNSSKRED